MSNKALKWIALRADSSSINTSKNHVSAYHRRWLQRLNEVMQPFAFSIGYLHLAMRRLRLQDLISSRGTHADSNWLQSLRVRVRGCSLSRLELTLSHKPRKGRMAAESRVRCCCDRSVLKVSVLNFPLSPGLKTYQPPTPFYHTQHFTRIISVHPCIVLFSHKEEKLRWPTSLASLSSHTGSET